MRGVEKTKKQNKHMMREIHIRPVLNGFVVTVGCQQLAYTSPDKLTADIGAYLHNPEEVEKRIVEQEGINRDHTLRPHPANECATQATDGAMAVGGLNLHARA